MQITGNKNSCLIQYLCTYRWYILILILQFSVKLVDTNAHKNKFKMVEVSQMQENPYNFQSFPFSTHYYCQIFNAISEHACGRFSANVYRHILTDPVQTNPEISAN